MKQWLTSLQSSSFETRIVRGVERTVTLAIPKVHSTGRRPTIGAAASAPNAPRPSGRDRRLRAPFTRSLRRNMQLEFAGWKSQ
jgi:hypothetical protein